MDAHPTTERQVIGEADRRALEEQEAAERAAAAERKTARKKAARKGGQTNDPEGD